MSTQAGISYRRLSLVFILAEPETECTQHTQSLTGGFQARAPHSPLPQLPCQLSPDVQSKLPRVAWNM